MRDRFAGSRIGRQTLDRLFFATFPDPPVAERIAALVRRLRVQHGLRARPLETERFHVSLYLVGNYFELPGGVVAQVSAAAEAISMRPFKVMFNRVMSFRGSPGHHPLVLCKGEGTDGFELFENAVGMAMKKAGLRYSASQGFHPHLTLLYGEREISGQPIEPISWTVRNLTLVHSRHGLTKYEPKGQWLLRDGAPVEPAGDHDVGHKGGHPKDHNKKPKENDQ